MENMNQFVTWGMLLDYATFVFMVYMIVAFTKDLKFNIFKWITVDIKKIPTKYWSALVAFTLMILTNLHGGTFAFWDLVIYALSAIVISLTANGVADFNKK